MVNRYVNRNKFGFRDLKFKRDLCAGGVVTESTTAPI